MQACGLQGVVARTPKELTQALNKAIEDQMKQARNTLTEATINQEPGEPFRCGAMKKPVSAAGSKTADMRQQTV